MVLSFFYDDLCMYIHCYYNHDSLDSSSLCPYFITMFILYALLLCSHGNDPSCVKKGQRSPSFTVMGSLLHMLQPWGYCHAIPSYTWGVTIICCCHGSIYEFTPCMSIELFLCIWSCLCFYCHGSICDPHMVLIWMHTHTLLEILLSKYTYACVKIFA